MRGTIDLPPRYRCVAWRSHKMGLALVALSVVVGCSTATNPPRLYLAPNGDELHVRLQPIEPNPF
jgi:hypothetical protein